MPKQNPWNPMTWVASAQDWFTKTERSSGFRPYLIFLLLLFGFSIVLLLAFHSESDIREFVLLALKISIAGFILTFVAKAFFDPNFCRSEEHVENVRLMDLAETKGDRAPSVALQDSMDETLTLKAPSPKQPEGKP